MSQCRVPGEGTPAQLQDGSIWLRLPLEPPEETGKVFITQGNQISLEHKLGEKPLNREGGGQVRELGEWRES